jgi:hypothetical protein
MPPESPCGTDRPSRRSWASTRASRSSSQRSEERLTETGLWSVLIGRGQPQRVICWSVCGVAFVFAHVGSSHIPPAKLQEGWGSGRLACTQCTLCVAYLHPTSAGRSTCRLTAHRQSSQVPKRSTSRSHAWRAWLQAAD